jgi:hypothetical protein
VRKLGIAVSCLLLILLAAILIGPSFIDWTDHKDALAREASRLSGRVLTIDGGMDLALLPRPHLRAEKVTLSGLEGGRARDLLQVEAMELRLRVAALLRGRIEVESLRLEEPRIVLEVLDDGRRNWDLGASRRAGADEGSAAGLGFIERIEVDQVALNGGEVRYLTADHDVTAKISGAQVRAKASVGAWRAAGKGSWRDTEFELQLSLSAPRAGGGRHLALELSLPRLAASGSFSGRMMAGGELSGLSGQIELKGDNLTALTEFLNGRGDGGSVLAGLPYQLSGELDWGGAARKIDGMELAIGGVRLAGSYDGAADGGNGARLSLSASRFDVERLTLDGNSGSALFALATALADRHRSLLLEIELQTTPYRGRLVRDLVLDAALTDGRVEVGELRATLPGGANVQLTGALELAGEAPSFRGQGNLSADNLRALLAWLALDPGDIAPRGLRRVSIDAQLEWTPQGLTLPSIEGSLDASRLEGALVVAFRERLALGLRLEIDRLDAAAYLAPWLAPKSGTGDAVADSPSAGPLIGADWLRDVDANVDIAIAELQAGTMAMGDVRIDATLRQGKVRLREASVARLPGAAVIYEGDLDLNGSAPALDGNLELDVPDPRAFSRAMGSPFVLIERLRPFSLRGIVKGDAQALHLEGLLREEGGEIAFSGDLRPTREEADFSVDLGYQNAGSFLRLFDAERDFRELQGPVELTAFFRRQAAGWTVSDLKGRMADTTLTGRLAFDGGGIGPRWEAEIRLGDLPASSLWALGAFGDPPEGSAGELGANWSRRHFELPQGLAATDGRLSLFADSLHWPGGRVEDLQAFMVTENEAIRVEKISGRLAGGTLLLTGNAVSEPIPEGRIAVTAIGADPGALTGAIPGLGLPSGGLTFNMTLAGAGASARELVSSLEGRGEMRGDLSFADASAPELEAAIDDLLGDFARKVGALARVVETAERAFLQDESEVSGSFGVAEGVLQLVDLRLVGKGALLRASGRFDLSRWRVDGLVELIEVDGPEGALLEVGLAGRIGDPDIKLRGRALSASGGAP